MATAPPGSFRENEPPEAVEGECETPGGATETFQTARSREWESPRPTPGRSDGGFHTGRSRFETARSAQFETARSMYDTAREWEGRATEVQYSIDKDIPVELGIEAELATLGVSEQELLGALPPASKGSPPPGHSSERRLRASRPKTASLARQRTTGSITAPRRVNPVHSARYDWPAPASSPQTAGHGGEWDGAGYDATTATTAGWHGAGYDATTATTAGWHGAGYDATTATTAGWHGAGYDATTANTAGWDGSSPTEYGASDWVASHSEQWVGADSSTRDRGGTTRPQSARPRMGGPDTRLGGAAVRDVFSLARHNRYDDVADLLDKGVPVDVQDAFGNTILLIACQNGLKRMAKLALRKGCDINMQNYKGNTALHFCYAYGYGDSLAAYLIDKGADDTIRNADGFLPHEGIA
jgi:hypothetical protein